jgi:hypothetical protein
VISQDVRQIAENGRLFVATVEAWNLLPLRLHVTVEAPPNKRIGIYGIPASHHWSAVLDPPASMHTVTEAQNLFIGHPRKSEAKVLSSVSGLPMRGHWLGKDLPLLILMPGRRVGFEMPFWRGGWMAVHYWEDDQ